jgi:hypothetical protein
VTAMRLFSSVVFSAACALASVVPATAGSVWDEARKVCTERYNDEVKSGTVPNGMNKTRYMNQCQGSYVRSVQLENELEDNLHDGTDGSTAHSKNGQGGPEILLPQTQPSAQVAGRRPAASTKPVPRFKPTI